MYKELQPQAAGELLNDGAVTILDIRDPDSYETAHLESAIQLNQASLKQFLDATARDQTLLVYCYHGISSAAAAAFLIEQGFSDVYHIVGGFQAWQECQLPTT